MGLRTALSQTAVVTFGVLLIGVWVVLTGLHVLEMSQTALGAGETIGQTAFSGVVGLLVILAALGLLVVLYGELSETDPAPSPWPPEE